MKFIRDKHSSLFCLAISDEEEEKTFPSKVNGTKLFSGENTLAYSA